MAVEYGGYVWISDNNAINWNKIDNAVVGNGGWNAAALSSDGTKIVVGAYGGYLYTGMSKGYERYCHYKFLLLI